MAKQPIDRSSPPSLRDAARAHQQQADAAVRPHHQQAESAALARKQLAESLDLRHKRKYRSGANAVARSGRSGQGEVTMGDESGTYFGEYLYNYGDEAPVKPFRSPAYEKSRLAYIAKFDKIDNSLTRPKKKK